MSTRDIVTVRETAPGVARITVLRPHVGRWYADVKRLPSDPGWWSCQEAGADGDFQERSRIKAIRSWLVSVDIDPDKAKITTLRSY